MLQKIRCGAHYCEVCKKCLKSARLRNNWQPDWWTVCDECGPGVLNVVFRPREESLYSRFDIYFEDIPKLVEELNNAYNNFDRGGT